MSADPCLPRRRLEACFAAATSQVHAGRALARCLEFGEDRTLRLCGRPIRVGAPLVVLALGKAAAAMAQTFEQVAGERIRAGLVVTKDGHGGDLPLRAKQRESAHPVPDARSEAAGRACLELAASVRPGEVMVVLLSGGASALTACPAPGLRVEDLARVTRALLACGADIAEMNALRKHLSAISGGRLAAAAARCESIEVLAVSDVAGDRLDVIGSGPCQADPSTFGEALAVLEQHGLRSQLPARVIEYLESGARGERAETPKPGAPEFARVRSRIIASNDDARRAAMRAGRSSGARAIDLGEILRGEARQAGRRLVGLARSLASPEPTLLVAGGETVVTLSGQGRGGRSQELALAAGIELERGDSSDRVAFAPRVTLLAAGTDGGDGPTPAAGACVDVRTCARARRAGLDPEKALRNHDSHPLLAAAEALLVTGPTGTNVMDLALVWVEPGAGSSKGAPKGRH